MRRHVSVMLVFSLLLASATTAHAFHGCRSGGFGGWGGWGGFSFSFRPSYYRSFGYSYGSSCYGYYPRTFYPSCYGYNPWTSCGFGWSPYGWSYGGYYDPYCGVSTVTPYYAAARPLNLFESPRLVSDRLDEVMAPRPSDEDDDQDARPLRRSNLAARKRALRYIGFGDALFVKQRFYESLQRYKTAAAIAPDLAEARFRQGHALVAGGQYALAAAAFKRALSLDPDVNRNGFRLDELYEGSILAKTAHIEQLSQAALENPDDPDLVFLVGMFLHYDGEAARAQTFFARAAEMLGPVHEHLAGFLHEQRPADPEREEPIVKVASKLEI